MNPYAERVEKAVSFIDRSETIFPSTVVSLRSLAQAMKRSETTVTFKVTGLLCAGSVKGYHGEQGRNRCARHRLSLGANPRPD